MDFSQRSGRPAPANSDGPAQTSSPKKSKGVRKYSNVKIISVVLLYSLTVLLIAVAIYAFVIGGKSNDQSKYISKGNYQAVFLNGGQVYFGQIVDANSKYMVMNDIYYLRVNQQVQPGQQASQNDISLVKLGCELHGPQDQMVINQEQVVFWENLKSDGQVAKAVAQFKQQNPNGLKCDQPAATPSTKK
jgi:hypothetical protein